LHPVALALTNKLCTYLTR